MLENDRLKVSVDFDFVFGDVPHLFMNISCGVCLLSDQGSKYRISGSYQMMVFISDIVGDIGDTRTFRAFISNTVNNEILITKSWFTIIDIIYQIKMM